MDWSFYWWGGGVSPISDFSSIIFKSSFMVGIEWERKNVNTPYFVYEGAHIRSLFLFLVMNNMWRFWCDALAVVTKWINLPKRNYYFWIINLLYGFKQLLFITLHLLMYSLVTHEFWFGSLVLWFFFQFWSKFNKCKAEWGLVIRIFWGIFSKKTGCGEGVSNLESRVMLVYFLLCLFCILLWQSPVRKIIFRIPKSHTSGL